MLTITSSVPKLFFAGSPAYVRVSTDLASSQDISFLRIVMLFQNSDGYSEKLVYNVDQSGEAVFNLSPFATTIIKNKESFSFDQEYRPSHSPYIAFFDLTLYEEYFYDGETIRTGSLTVTTLRGLPGKLYDNERASLSPNLFDYLKGKTAVMSRKPLHGDVAIKGSPYYLPFFADEELDLRVNLRQGSTQLLTAQTDYTPKGSVNYNLLVFNIPSSADNAPATLFTPTASREVYITSPSASAFPLVFVNGFGLLESTVAFCRPNATASVSSEQFDIAPDSNFSAFRTSKSQTYISDTEIALSSGNLNQQWLQWWLYEVIPSPLVWIYIDNAWKQGCIIPSENYALYNRTSSSTQKIDFSIRLATKDNNAPQWNLLTT